MRSPISLALILLAIATTQACDREEPAPKKNVQGAVVVALDYLVAELAAERPVDATEYAERLQDYLEVHPVFYGAADVGVWTSPYFDAGGGEIWMITRSVPARDSAGIFAIVTTDLPVDGPDA